MAGEIEQAIANNLDPLNPELKTYCMRQGADSLSRDDEALVSKYDPAKLNDRAFQLEQGRDYLSTLLKQRYGQALIELKRVDYANQMNGPQFGRFLKGDFAAVQMAFVREGSSQLRILGADRGKWRWRLHCASLDEMPY